MRERELEILGDKLLDIWSSDKVGFFELDNFQDLEKCKNLI